MTLPLPGLDGQLRADPGRALDLRLGHLELLISASEEVLRRLRVEAAMRSISVSRFVRQVLDERFRDDDAYERSMADLLSRSPQPPTRATRRRANDADPRRAL